MNREQMEALGMATDWLCDVIDKRDARIAELERDLELARTLNEGTFRANLSLFDQVEDLKARLAEAGR